MKIGDLVCLNEDGKLYYGMTQDLVVVITGYKEIVSFAGTPGCWTVLHDEKDDYVIMVANEKYWDVCSTRSEFE